MPHPISPAHIPSRRKSSLVTDQTCPICVHAVFLLLPSSLFRRVDCVG